MSTSWKSLITELESLTKNNGLAAWRTAQILRALWKDREFTHGECSGNLDEVEKRLAAFSGRFCVGVNDMIQMIENFPKEADWVSGRLDVLRDETCKALLPKKEPSKLRTSKTPTVPLDQYDELMQKYRDLKADHRVLKAAYRKLESEHKESEKRISQLESQQKARPKQRPPRRDDRVP